jgi:uracil-DNA glycosylase family 4
MRSIGIGGAESTAIPALSVVRPTRSFEVAWSRLEAEIRACERCPLHQTRTNAVIYRGSPRPKIIFVGEAPGATEDRVGLPFVGRSGLLLDAALREADVPPEAFGILNLIKCRPPKNVFDRAAAGACRPYLDRQLALLGPSVLVSVGAQALRSLDPGAPRVLLAAGQPRALGSRALFPLIHPAAAMRSRALAERWRNDFATLGTWLHGSGPLSAREPI